MRLFLRRVLLVLLVLAPRAAWPAASDEGPKGKLLAPLEIPAVPVANVLPGLAPLPGLAQIQAASGQSASAQQTSWLVPEVLSGAASPIAATPLGPAAVAPMRESFSRQLEAMAQAGNQADRALLSSIGIAAKGVLDRLQATLEAAALDTTAAASDRPARIGFYPIAGDPVHWGHVIIGLEAAARLKVDRVVFVPAGDDARKPDMTPANLRHPMIRAALAPFAPLLQYSPIALGTALIGETNLFRFLAKHADRRVDAYYLVGDDHYRLLDKNGGPDTIPKIEANILDPELGFRPDRHRVSLAFIKREGRGVEKIETPLEVRFLPAMAFEASSTDIRKRGNIALMPYDAYDFVRGNGLGLYGIAPR